MTFPNYDYASLLNPHEPDDEGHVHHEIVWTKTDDEPGEATAWLIMKLNRIICDPVPFTVMAQSYREVETQVAAVCQFLQLRIGDALRNADRSLERFQIRSQGGSPKGMAHLIVDTDLPSVAPFSVYVPFLSFEKRQEIIEYIRTQVLADVLDFALASPADEPSNDATELPRKTYHDNTAFGAVRHRLPELVRESELSRPELVTS